jgi:predicted small lipoprotein YifL
MQGKAIIMLILVALLLGNLLGGCGQKGPLYLPEKDEPSQSERSD